MPPTRFMVPANRKWCARIAVQRLLLGVMRRLDPKWPAADYDIEAEKKRSESSNH